jgi:hypothetical protein
MALEIGEREQKVLQDRIGDFMAEQIIRSGGNEALIAELIAIY